MKSETAGLPAGAQSINHMLSFQGRLKSASHSDVRIKPLKINVSCPPLPLCLLSLCVSLSLSLSLTVTQSSGKNIDFVSLFLFSYFFLFLNLCSSMELCIAAAAVTAYAPGLATGSSTPPRVFAALTHRKRDDNRVQSAFYARVEARRKTVCRCNSRLAFEITKYCALFFLLFFFED